MSENDVRPEAWDIRGPAGTTRTITADVSDLDGDLVVHLGGEVGADGLLVDIDDLDGTTEIEGPPWVVPFGEEATPIRWVYDGVVQSVGRLRPSRLGAPSPSGTLSLVTADVSLELTLLGGSGGGSGTVTSVAEVEPTSGDVPRASLVAELQGTGSGDLAAGNAVSTHAAGSGVHSIAGVTGLQAALDAKPADYRCDLMADPTTAVDGTATTVDLINPLDFEATPINVSLATVVGFRLLIPSGANAGIWTVTASGAWTAASPQPKGRQTVNVGSAATGATVPMVGVNTAGLGGSTSTTAAASSFAVLDQDVRDSLDDLDTAITEGLSDLAGDLATTDGNLAVLDDTVTAQGAGLANLANAAQSPFAAWLHNGATADDGVTEWLDDIEYVGLTGKEGTPYEGVAVHRPAAATISGATPDPDFTGVIYLTGQDTADHDGAHELFHTLASVGYEQADVEAGGVLFETWGITDLDIGLYTTQTQTWNWGWIDPADDRIVDDVVPIGLEVLQSGSVFRVGGGSNAGLWATTVDGIHGPAIPLAEWAPVTLDGATTTVADALDDHDGRIGTLEAAATPWTLAARTGSAIVDTTTETTIASGTLPTLAAGDIIDGTVRGRYLNNSGSGKALTLRLKLGTLTLTLTPFSAVASLANDRHWEANFQIHAQSATHVDVVGMVMPDGNLTGNRATPIANQALGGSSISVTVQHSAASPSTEVQMDQVLFTHRPA